MIRRSKLTTILTAAALSMAIAVVNCSKGGAPSPEVGNVKLDLVTPTGYTINSVTYQLLSSTSSVLQTGTIDVSNPGVGSTIDFDLVLPVGTGYKIVLAADSVSPSVRHFTGTSGSFDVTAGAPITVLVTLTDTGAAAGATGTVIVHGTIVPGDTPPTITSVVVAPSQTGVNGLISVSAAATDPDAGDHLTFKWTSTAGSFADSTAAATTFSSVVAGSPVLTLTVSDNHSPTAATTSVNLTVTIVNVGGGTGGAGTGGAGTGGANTGGAGTGGANTGGANTGGANTGGAHTGGAGTGGANTGGANTGGANTGGANTGGANTGGANTGGANTGGANTGGSGAGGLFDAAALEAAADFELNSQAAADAFLDCDPTKLTGNQQIVDSNGNSWGPNTLGNLGQKIAFTNLLSGIFNSLNTADDPGPGPGGSVGLHGWPNLSPRLTGVATNASNNGPGNRAINGGLLGFGASPSSLVGGTLNGALALLYKQAAIADGLVNSSNVPLTLSSTNAEFGAAIASVGTNPRTAIGLADNIAQCALTISIGVDATGVVLPTVTTFTHNVVEDLKK